jgi:hypothetical protein
MYDVMCMIGCSVNQKLSAIVGLAYICGQVAPQLSRRPGRQTRQHTYMQASKQASHTKTAVTWAVCFSIMSTGMYTKDA